jgi:hypothetical protein
MRRTPSPETGSTLVEALVAIAVIGIAVVAVAPNLRSAEAPLETGVSLFEGFVRQTRTRAMATTSACRLRPGGDGLVAEHADSCDEGLWTAEDDLRLDLPRDVTITEPEGEWSVCFDGRGISSDNIVVGLSHPRLGTRRIEIMLGGGTREVGS